MKNLIFGIIVLALTLFSSCKKNTSAPGGFWSFKGMTYNTTSCFNGTYGTLVATNSSPSNTNNIGFVTVTFPDAVLPATGGTYTVVGTAMPTGNQVKITLATGGAGGSYFSTGGNGSNQTVSVSMSAGKVSVSGAGIEMSDLGTDSSTLMFNITQTQ